MTPDIAQRPKVGVGVIVMRDGKILLSKRKGDHAAGVYGSCGGHLEQLESFEACARREAFEEAGVELGEMKFLCLTNYTTHAPKHYVDIGFVGQWKSGEPTVKEPDRHEEWGWYSLDALPQPLFPILELYLEAYRTGRIFFDT